MFFEIVYRKIFRKISPDAVGRMVPTNNKTWPAITEIKKIKCCSILINQEF